MTISFNVFCGEDSVFTVTESTAPFSYMEFYGQSSPTYVSSKNCNENKLLGLTVVQLRVAWCDSVNRPYQELY